MFEVLAVSTNAFEKDGQTIQFHRAVIAEKREKGGYKGFQVVKVGERDYEKVRALVGQSFGGVLLFDSHGRFVGIG